jgi:hypothetical protein
MRLAPHDQEPCAFYRTIRSRVLFTARSGAVCFLLHDQEPCPFYCTIRRRVFLIARSGTVSFLPHDKEPCPSYHTIRGRVLLIARSGTVSHIPHDKVPCPFYHTIRISVLLTDQEPCPPETIRVHAPGTPPSLIIAPVPWLKSGELASLSSARGKVD